MQNYYVYILASQRNGTLYTGRTTDLYKRVWQHKEKIVGGFTAKYNVIYLVHFEIFDNYQDAAHREKCIKDWKRKWKLALIESHNRQWKDLYYEL